MNLSLPGLLCRRHGPHPFQVAVVHGGPGAAGEMAPLAVELAKKRGVLEPFQTENSFFGQVEELASCLLDAGEPPLVLIGFSWGACLSLLVAAHKPALVRKLILVGCGPLDVSDAQKIEEARLGRLQEKERAEYRDVVKILDGASPGDKAAALARLGELALKTDSFDPWEGKGGSPLPNGYKHKDFSRALKEALEYRRSGRLLEAAGRLRCPVTAIHGDYDPHPGEGVRKPLSGALEDFRWILLEQCGHKPWIERRARDTFQRILDEELKAAS